MNTARSYPTARPTDAYLFGTCVLDLFDPEAGLSAAKLLEREGIRVHFPQDQTCCGQPAYTSGLHEEARQVAASQLHLFPEPWPVVVPSGSCAGMMRHHWPKLFAGRGRQEEQACAIAERVFELTEFLIHVCGTRLTDLGRPASAVLHTSCSARREMGVHLTSHSLLGQLANVTLAEQHHESECCGFGGTFAVRHPDISAAMAADKTDALIETGADTLVSADGGCLLNLNGTLEKREAKLRGQHIASFLWQRTKGEEA